jgi:hypothetical protein
MACRFHFLKPLGIREGDMWRTMRLRDAAHSMGSLARVTGPSVLSLKFVYTCGPSE